MSVIDASNVGEIPATEEQPATEAQPEEQPSGLPSDAPEQQASPWERAKQDGYLPDDYKEDAYELAKSWKNGQDFVEKANAEKGAAGHAIQDAKKAAELQDNIMSLVPDFVKNGMALNDEMIEKGKEWGLDERDIKIAAYDYRDRINSAYDLVGGEEVYSSMMKDMAESMSTDEQKEFNADLGGKASKYAIKGLFAEWKAQSKADGKQPDRIEGKVQQRSGTKPYEDQREMLKDLSYLRTKGKNDKAAWKQYEARKAVTEDKIIMGR